MDKNEFCSVYNMHIVTDDGLAELHSQMRYNMSESRNIGYRIGEYEHILDRLKEIEATLKRLHIDIDSMFPSTTSEASMADNAMTWLLEAIENVIRAKDSIKAAYDQAHKSDNNVLKNIDHIIDHICV